MMIAESPRTGEESGRPGLRRGAAPSSLRRPDRILHVPRRFVADEWGGTETVILEVSKCQKEQGWRPEIITSRALSHAPQEVMAGVPIQRHRYTYPFLGLSEQDRLHMDKKGGNLVSSGLLLALLRAPDVRVFHAHALKRLGGEVRVAARLRRRPYVVSVHGGVFDVPSAEAEAMEAPFRGKFEWGRPLGALLGSRRVLEDADHVVCVGQSEMLAAREALSHDRVSYVPNGTDTARFARGDGAAFRIRHRVSPTDRVILNISRLDAQKNQALLLEAFLRFHARAPASHLFLIGPETQPGYANQLRRAIGAAGLPNRIHLLPGFHPDDPNLLDAYAAADVFALPSRHEPFGIVVLEAWSAGKPVVASRVGGLQRLVSDGVNGLFFEPEATDAAAQLSRCLERLHHDDGLARQLGEAGREEARRHYDWSRVTDRLEAVYARAEAHAASRSNQGRVA